MVSTAKLLAPDVYYPESDGQPMAETEIHGDIIENLKHMLRYRYRDDPRVQVGGNLFLYYAEGDPTQVMSPDVYVTFGIDKALRRTYKVWEEGKAPDVVFEVTSESSRYRDLGAKKGLYEVLGVREYFLFDPLGEYLDPPLRAFRLGAGGYQLISGDPLGSEVLGLRFEWTEEQLIVTDRQSGETLLTASQQAERADREAERAEQERAAREAAEKRLRDLEEKQPKS